MTECVGVCAQVCVKKKTPTQLSYQTSHFAGSNISWSDLIEQQEDKDGLKNWFVGSWMEPDDWLLQ